MAKEKAINFLLYVTGTPTAMGSEQNTVLTRNHTPIDVTDKGSDDWEENLAGLRNWTLENNGFYITNDTAYEALETAYEDNTPVDVKLRDTNNNDQWTGSAYITSLQLSTPNPEAVQQAISLKGTGALARSTF